LDLSKSIEEIIPHQNSKTEEEDRVQQGKPEKEDKYSPGQPIKFREAKRGLKKKGARLWVIKKLKINRSIELEDPYSRRRKVVTRRFVQQNGYPP